MSHQRKSVVIIGAGMAGLTCALELERRAVDYVLLEAADQVGGRVRTDQVDGFLLDRGFQILLTGYPEIRRLCNYQQLILRPFRSGALIRHNNQWLVLPDPLKEPRQLLATLRSPVGSMADKMRVGMLSLRSLLWREGNCFRQSPETSREFLHRQGFSPRMFELFWRPFFGGVFLDDELATGSDLFRYLFSLFVRSQVTLCDGGIQQIPNQLARRLNEERIHLETPVQRLDGRQCWDTHGNCWEGDHVVVAVDGAAAARLLPQQPEPAFHGTHCSYFAAPLSPGGKGRIQLNAQRDSCVHHVVVLSDVAQGYAPAGGSLISVSSQTQDLPGEAELRRELSTWYGADTIAGWKLLRQYSVPRALPAFGAGQRRSDFKLGEGLWRCGDYLSYPSLNAAVGSGRIVAESLGYGAAK